MSGHAWVVIPARGGSVGVPLKNLQKVGGVTLIGRAVRAARAARRVTAVLVSTDHPRIAEEAVRHGATVIERPADLAGSRASSESAVLHAISVHEQDHDLPDVTVLMQCTSPFINSDDLDAAIASVTDGRRDVVLSVTQSHDFQWYCDNSVSTPPTDRSAATQAQNSTPVRISAVGHSIEHRQRRQDRSPHYRETGAFYAMRTDGLRRTGRRFFGDIGIQQVDGRTSIEIDTADDLWLAQRLARGIDPYGEGRSAPWLDVDAVVTDFDGVHTDDHALVTADGTELVRVHRGDGLGIAAVRRRGIPMMILSTETNPVVGARAAKLGIDVQQGIDDKAAELRRWMSDHDLDPDRVAYVGNDVNDLPAMAIVGWPVAVLDAHPDVLAAARLVLNRPGGDGAVRELCDLVLAARATADRAAGQNVPDDDQMAHPDYSTWLSSLVLEGN